MKLLPDELESCVLGRCDGSGWLQNENDESYPCECRAERARRRQTRRLGTGIPKRFRGVSFERKPVCDLDPHVIRGVQDYTRKINPYLDEGRGLWFTGDVGTGKTSLAMLVSKTALDAGRSVAVFTVPHLLATIKHTYEADSEGTYKRLFDRLCAVDLLHLDDLGTERQTDWVLEQLYLIVNARWEEERAVVATTNIVTLEELREQIGERTVSRLTEICGDPIALMGPDLRMRRSA